MDGNALTYVIVTFGFAIWSLIWLIRGKPVKSILAVTFTIVNSLSFVLLSAEAHSVLEFALILIIGISILFVDL